MTLSICLDRVIFKKMSLTRLLTKCIDLFQESVQDSKMSYNQRFNVYNKLGLVKPQSYVCNKRI